ncbi:MAG: tRNA uridine-5-carboxymethylaminomethyl(34) synthesis GTPase MnmE, partial [Caulobacteraceae bacterium]
DGAARRFGDDHGLAIIEISLAREGGDRLAAMEAAVRDRVVADCSGAEFPATTRARHAVLLRAALDHLRRASATLATPELAAEDVRLAARSLSQITGEVGVEDVLDHVFAKFCIGK